MAFNSKQYIPGEMPHPVNSNFAGPRKHNRWFYLRTGIIEDVDVDKYQMRISWTDGNGAHSNVPISFPYVGPAGCMGSLPEKGAIGIFAFYNEGMGTGSPLCVGFLPRALDSGLSHATVKTYPDALPTDDTNEIQYKFRKLTVGDMTMNSPAGSFVFLNKDVEISDAMQDSIIIRDGDQAIIQSCLNNFIFADGASVSAGPAVRNSMILYDSNGNKIEETNGSLVTLPNGKDIIYIVPYGNAIDYSTKFYTEYRIDVDDQSDGKLDLNDVNSSSPITIRDPVVTLAMGNYIGPDKRNSNLYGRILKVRLFTASNDVKGGFSLEPASQNAGVDEPGQLGMAYALHFLKSGAFMGFDKEGHHYLNLPASRINPLGAGRSMSILGQGNLKEIWGPTAAEANSWDLTTKGGVKWVLGAHNASQQGRSLDIRTSRGIYIEVGTNADAGADGIAYAKQEVLKGNVAETIGGAKTEISGNKTITINGLKSENITGSYTSTVQSDKSENILGVYSETVVKEKQSKIGTRKTTITTGNDTLEVIRGDIKETITTFGKRITNVLAGGIEQTLTSGTHKTTIQAGSYKLNVTAGGIEIKTSAGTVNMAGTSVSIKGNLSVTVDAPIVKVGQGAPFGGAITGLPGTSPSHFDYVVGAALKGSMKVGIA
jgi:hypothetical protein